ncbi:PrsW family glutamic-type intramembrane protease [Nicoliella spurrieriana]|uniref:PrsW family glutamic-type intramembrane protease n=1 Tax=Nicoliella spurrieriana TaxID=2925830 RepID=A0A976X5Q2_9LACO|nr:PrsW family glutamic-type intramembrane protease [Nicoliella spurrieriana]UQS87150.1 PrsW family glutamic-type intramembrane protease [Nicoliella spurrieriana]
MAKNKLTGSLHTVLLSTTMMGVKRNYARIKDDIKNEANRGNQFVEIHLSQLFQQVFHRHSRDEADRIMIAGTKQTTPALTKVSSAPVKPWLFSRFFMLLSFSFLLLTILYLGFGSDKAIPGMMVVGSLVVPFSILIMFFEMNVYRNISLMQVNTTMLVGGVASLLLTMVLYDVIPSGNGVSLGSALLVGFIEETAKTIIIVIFINRFKLNYILNGILIGAAIGAGFAIFETAGYSNEFGLSTILLRSWQAIGTHTIWAAIIGAAVILGKQRYHHFTLHDALTNAHFLSYYLVAILLHAMWDWQFPVWWVNEFYLLKYLLIVVGWVIIFWLIDAGLREVRTLQGQQIRKRLK